MSYSPLSNAERLLVNEECDAAEPVLRDRGGHPHDAVAWTRLLHSAWGHLGDVKRRRDAHALALFVGAHRSCGPSWCGST